MARKTFAVVRQALELRHAALAANSTDLPQMEIPRQKAEAVLAELNDVTAQQATLTAAKQEASKRLAALHIEAQRLTAFVDAGIRDHYGPRSEKLVEFGQQPFRSKPRVRLVGLDGKPVKPGAHPIPADPPAPAPAHG